MLALKNYGKTGKNVGLSVTNNPTEVESKIRIMAALIYHKRARTDVTHILSKESCFLLKSFHFRRLQKP